MSTGTKVLPPHAHLAHLRKQAKERLQELRRKDAGAALHDAQLSVAREYGFPSWPKLGKHVRGQGLERALADLRAGRPVILFDAEGRENEGDFVLPATAATAAAVNFITKHGRGTLCLALTPERVDRLGLALMAPARQSPADPAFTLSIDAADGGTTGVSAADRAATIRAAAADDAGPQSVRTPGHVFPLRAEAGGLKARAGHTEGSVELMRLAGLAPAAVICEILNDDGTMARMPDLEGVAAAHGLALVRMSDLSR
jgi:3,4-dihydroxy 2-butanone 4-phosphate synthase/GTP cyclohydrolase II